jgi:hypothetical protein
MHITHAVPGEKLIGQFPRAHKKKADRSEKLRVPIEELIEKISDYMTERPAVIDCRLAALRAPMSAQLRSAVLTMRERWPLRFSAAEKSSASARRLFEWRYPRVA